MSNVVKKGKSSFGLENPNNLISLGGEEILSEEERNKSEMNSSRLFDFMKYKGEGEIDAYGKRFKKAEVYSQITYKNKEGNTKLDIEKFVSFLIDSYKPIYNQGALFLYKDGVYNEVKENYLKTIIKQLLPSGFRTRHFIEEVAGQLLLDERVNKDVNQYSNVMDIHDENLINCNNGIINLNDMQLYGHTEKIKSTIQINANCDKDAKCDNFLKFLDTVVPNKEVQKVLQEIVGYSITKMVESRKRIFILTGESGTGKSTFLNATVEALLPKNSKSHIPLQTIEKDKFAAVQLLGKTTNIFADLKTEALKDVGTLKTITGDDGGIFVQRKGKDGYSAQPFCKMLFSCNHMPSNLAQDKTDAFYNRIMIISFNQIIEEEERDSKLKEKLEAELDGIFAWAIEGLVRLIKNKYNFSKCKEIEDNINEYKQENNSILQFIDEFCEVTNNEDDYIMTSRFHTAYNNFCEEELDQRGIGVTNVKKQLNTKYNIERKKKNYKQLSGRNWAYVGIKYKNELIEQEVEKRWMKLTEKN